MPGKFLLVRCKRCKNEQVIFNKASTEVRCLVCGALLAKPRGGKARIKGSIIKVFR